MVLYDETGNQLPVLNDIGAAIWLLIDGQRTLDKIADVVVDTLGTPRLQVIDDLGIFLKELEDKDLITWQ